MKPLFDNMRQINGQQMAGIIRLHRIRQYFKLFRIQLFQLSLDLGIDDLLIDTVRKHDCPPNQPTISIIIA